MSKWQLEASTDNQNWQMVVPTSAIAHEYSSTFHINRSSENAAANTSTLLLSPDCNRTNGIQIAELQLFGIPFTESGNAFMDDMMSEYRLRIVPVPHQKVKKDIVISICLTEISLQSIMNQLTPSSSLQNRHKYKRN